MSEKIKNEVLEEVSNKPRGSIDKNLIYSLTKKINDNLHFKFGIKNLNHRMVFTACALVARRYGATLVEGMNWETLRSSISSVLEESYGEAKLDLLNECFTHIQCNFGGNQDAINEFLECVEKISENINSDHWNGEDVMGIFFNEFTRYKGKTESGQVFTPDHITSLMYRITGTHKDDRVLDACCGSGAFLTKAMCNMIAEAGGVNAYEARKIKQEQLYGIEFDREIFALACANMLIHKYGKMNLIQDDSRTENVGEWIRSKNITKVLMNPPYENKYGCLDIVKNVLDNVTANSICAFILPDKKLELAKKHVKKWLDRHTLQKIIKLPDIFAGMSGVVTSIFIFKTGEAQNSKPIFSCWLKDDGLETVKNQGRHDTKNKWQAIEDYWASVIYRQSGDDTIQWLDPNESLYYKIPEPDFQIEERDFKRTILEYILFESQIDEKDFREKILEYILFESQIDEKDSRITIGNARAG
jgi:type I restriction-modification system DNA methylase subunit